MNHENGQRESARANRGVGHVCQDRVGWTRIEEEAETSQENKNPIPRTAGGHHQKHHGKSHEHCHAGYKEIGAGIDGTKLVTGNAAQKRGEQTGNDNNESEPGIHFA